MEELVQLSEQELMTIKGFCRRSLDEIRAKLGEYPENVQILKWQNWRIKLLKDLCHNKYETNQVLFIIRTEPNI